MPIDESRNTHRSNHNRPMIESLVIATLLRSASAFVVPGQAHQARSCLTLATPSAKDSIQEFTTWSPQDFTKDNPGFPDIPKQDYIKQYQENPELWPVEFFLIVYRRSKSNGETQVLVRRSANGTSKYGVGTGVPATRWLLSSDQPPRGYEWSNPSITFEAKNFPEFDATMDSWIYRKIDICEDAFRDGQGNGEFQDVELENYASMIRDHLRTELSPALSKNEEKLTSWEAKTVAVVQRILDEPKSVAAIQGTLRMSGLFERRLEGSGEDDDRYVRLGKPDRPDPSVLAKSVKIYTMFPQMPDPMPLPSTSPNDLKEEIASRYSRMIKAGRDLHQDKYGRTYTHISTSNVSNTIHGVYLSLDLTDHLPEPKLGDDESVPPALDLFGTKTIEREWISLEELKVLSEGERSIATDDPKPTFISGFIVRQLVKDGVIGIDGDIRDK